jgi:flagellar hook-length control protein FliK
LAPNATTDSSRVRDFAPEAPFRSEEPAPTSPDRNKTSAGLEKTIKLAPVPGAAAISFAREPSAFFTELSSEAFETSGKDPANVLPSRFETELGFSATSGFDYGMARADSVRNAAAQAVEVIIRQPGKPVEITLNPEELGRVRMALTTTESGVTVVITSERPETLDLMRRHIDQLAQEFLRLGYENTAFEFGSDSGNGSPAPKGLPNTEKAESGLPNADKTLHPTTSRLVSTGLDLRL